MQVLHEEFADDPNVQVIGAHVGAGDDRMNSVESLEEYAETNGYTYTMVPDGRGIADTFEMAGIPYFVVIGPDGEIVADHLGRLTDEARDELAAAVRSVR